MHHWSTKVLKNFISLTRLGTHSHISFLCVPSWFYFIYISLSHTWQNMLMHSHLVNKLCVLHFLGLCPETSICVCICVCMFPYFVFRTWTCSYSMPYWVPSFRLLIHKVSSPNVLTMPLYVLLRCVDFIDDFWDDFSTVFQSCIVVFVR